MKCIICHYGNIMKLLQIFHLFLLYLHSAVRWECVFVKVVVDTKWSFSKEVVYKVELTVSVRWMDMESTFSTRWTRKIAFYAQHSVQATNFQLQSCSEEVIMHRTKLATGRVNDIPALCEELRTFTYYCRHRRITKKFTTTHLQWMVSKRQAFWLHVFQFFVWKRKFSAIESYITCPTCVCHVITYS